MENPLTPALSSSPGAGGHGCREDVGPAAARPSGAAPCVVSLSSGSAAPLPGLDGHCSLGPPSDPVLHPPPPPTGEHCEVNARSGRCAHGVCKNGGTCVNLLIGGFRCVCPPGDFERPYCEVTTRSFPPRSFVTFRGLRQRFHFSVALT